MDELARSILLGSAPVSSMLVLGGIFAAARQTDHTTYEQRYHLVFQLIAAIATQTTHVAEEYATGFHHRWPTQFGLVPWPGSFFLAANALLVGLWGLSTWGVVRNFRIAWFPIWFLALGLAGNGIWHPICSIYHGSYFPGLVTGVLTGIFGIVLLARMWRLTTPPAIPSSP